MYLCMYAYTCICAYVTHAILVYIPPLLLLGVCDRTRMCNRRRRFSKSVTRSSRCRPYFILYTLYFILYSCDPLVKVQALTMADRDSHGARYLHDPLIEVQVLAALEEVVVLTAVRSA